MERINNESSMQLRYLSDEIVQGITLQVIELGNQEEYNVIVPEHFIGEGILSLD